MANTLESLKGTSQIVVHNSATDLKDKSPLQAYKGATISQIAKEARPVQPNRATLTDADVDPIPTDSIDNGIAEITPTADRNKVLPDAADLIEALGLLEVNMSFDFTVINLASSTHTVTINDTGASGVSITGNKVVQPNSSGRFRICNTTNAGASVRVYRIA